MREMQFLLPHLPWFKIMSAEKFIRHRLNKGTYMVLEALGAIGKLCSAQEICKWLKENAPGLTTVYRAIDTLLNLNMVQVVDLGDGEKRFERIEPGKHHHHLTCTQCSSSIHLDQCFLENMRTVVEEHHRFKVKSHILEIFGICNSCLGSRAKESGSSD